MLFRSAALLRYKFFSQFTGALDTLLYELNATADQLNASTLHTVCQALDFLATIATPECIAGLPDPGAASLLIVDDEEGSRQFISAALDLAGMRSDSAASASEALEKVEASRFDTIFLDVGLPGVNGFDLCGRIRAIERFRDVPIVFITGMATFLNKAKASLSGGSDFIEIGRAHV